MIDFTENYIPPATSAYVGLTADANIGEGSVVEVARALVDSLKEFPALELRGALLDGTLFEGKAGVEQLAKFPTKSEAIAQVVTLVVSPAKKLVAQVKGPGSNVAGIIKAVAQDAIALLHRRGRSFAHAPVATPADDPLLQQVIGQVEAAAFAAEATVLAAAEALDRATASANGGAIDEALAHKAALAAAKAKVIVDELAIRAGSQLFDVGGASAAKRESNLDRHWRNARTLAAHNPVSYKAQAVGAHAVRGTALPKTGFF